MGRLNLELFKRVASSPQAIFSAIAGFVVAALIGDPFQGMLRGSKTATAVYVDAGANVTAFLNSPLGRIALLALMVFCWWRAGEAVVQADEKRESDRRAILTDAQHEFDIRLGALEKRVVQLLNEATTLPALIAYAAARRADYQFALDTLKAFHDESAAYTVQLREIEAGTQRQRARDLIARFGGALGTAKQNAEILARLGDVPAPEIGGLKPFFVETPYEFGTRFDPEKNPDYMAVARLRAAELSKAAPAISGVPGQMKVLWDIAERNVVKELEAVYVARNGPFLRSPFTGKEVAPRTL